MSEMKFCRIFVKDAPASPPTFDGVTAVSGYFIRADPPELFGEHRTPCDSTREQSSRLQDPPPNGGGSPNPTKRKRSRSRRRSRHPVEATMPVEAVEPPAISKSVRSWLAFDSRHRVIHWNGGQMKVGLKTFRFVRLLWESKGHRATFEHL